MLGLPEENWFFGVLFVGTVVVALLHH